MSKTFTIRQARQHLKEVLDLAIIEPVMLVRGDETFVLSRVHADQSDRVHNEAERVHNESEKRVHITESTPEPVYTNAPACCLNRRKMCEHWRAEGFEYVNSVTGERFDPTASQ